MKQCFQIAAQLYSLKTLDVTVRGVESLNEILPDYLSEDGIYASNSQIYLIQGIMQMLTIFSKLDMFKGYTCLYVEGYLVQNHDMVVKAMELATQAGLQICLDLASANIVRDDLEFFTYLVNKYVDIVFANEDEAKAFTGLEPEQAIDEIAKACSIAVVKVGKHGAYIKKGTEMIHVPALDVKNVADTTGAGDYFAAGFLYGLLGGYSFEKCGKIGSILSGRVIQTIGASLTDRAWAKGQSVSVVSADGTFDTGLRAAF